MRAVYGFGDPIISADLSGEGLFSWLGDVWRSVGHSVLCHVGTATSILVAGACIIGTAGWCAGFMAAAFVGGVFQRGTNLGYANTVPQDIAAGITSVGVFGLVKVPAMIVRDAKLAMPLWQRAIYTAPSGVTPAANAAANYVAPQHGSCG